MAATSETEATKQFLRQNDRSYKEVRRTIVRKQRKGARDVNEEEYVDTYRNVAVHFDAGDLKSAMAKTGMKSIAAGPCIGPGEPDDQMYLKQAEHLMKRGAYKPALLYLEQALAINPTSNIVQSTRAKCLLFMGKWEEARNAADTVLDVDKKYVKALLVKAEALYNTCKFEHALVLFHRGLVLAPEGEDFRLGVQKCRKTIQCTISPKFRFLAFPGVEKLFSCMRKECELLSSVTGSGHLTEKQKKAKIREDSKLNGTDNRVVDINVENDESKENEMMVRRVKKRHKLNDRLGEDKEYLTRLAETSLQMTSFTTAATLVDRSVSDTANEALNFLKARDDFWKQVELTTGKKPPTSTTRLHFDKLM